MIQLDRLKICNWIQPCVCCEQTTSQALLCDYCMPTCLDFAEQEINLLTYPNIQRMVNLAQCDGLSAVSWYRPPMSHWIQSVKFHHSRAHLCALNVLAHHLWRRFDRESAFPVDIICCLPLHQHRLIQRGYNQVEQIWRGLPLNPTILTRNRKTRAQSALSKAQRKLNLRNAFSAKPTVAGKNILLLEDVITTGATMDAAAKACKASGANAVWAMSIGLTPFDA
ncbi:ComF family protein [Pseudoalteromonas piscicida]|uniref:ComF family protein n=1 Tax=Pseudoalteromonas piscicida TaxID=43662 RepID=UPI0030B16433